MTIVTVVDASTQKVHGCSQLVMFVRQRRFGSELRTSECVDVLHEQSMRLRNSVIEAQGRTVLLQPGLMADSAEQVLGNCTFGSGCAFEEGSSHVSHSQGNRELDCTATFLHLQPQQPVTAKRPLPVSLSSKWTLLTPTWV